MQGEVISNFTVENNFWYIIEALLRGSIFVGQGFDCLDAPAGGPCHLVTVLQGFGLLPYLVKAVDGLDQSVN